jgi:signal transduction histidine kinase
MARDVRAAPAGAPLTLSGFVAAGLVALGLVAATYWMSLRQNTASAWVNQTHEALASIANTRAALLDVQSANRGFAITGNENELQPYEYSLHVVQSELARLRTLVADNPEQVRNLRELQDAVSPRLQTARELVTLRRELGFEAAKALIDSGVPVQQMRRVRDALQRMEDTENELLAKRMALHRSELWWFWVGVGSVVGALLLALAVLYAQVRRRRAVQDALIEAQDALQHLNRSLEAQVAERTARLEGANADLLQTQQRLKDLSSRLISAQEQERRHIARELHDETGQALTAIRLNLADLQRGAQPSLHVPECLRIVDRAIGQIRGMALNLRPTMLDDLGLVDALEWALDRQGTAAGWRVSFEADALDDVALSPDVQTACFRIAQEAMTNAARHAGAGSLHLAVHLLGSDLELVVSDDGAGFDAARFRTPEERRKHFGLVSMTERAALVGGRLDLDTAPGRGTRVRAVFPLEGEAALI